MLWGEGGSQRLTDKPRISGVLQHKGSFLFASCWSDGFPWWLFIRRCLGIPGPFDLVMLRSSMCGLRDAQKRGQDCGQPCWGRGWDSGSLARRELPKRGLGEEIRWDPVNG